MKVAFVLKGYPRLSETFIAQEIAALERRGLDIHIVSLRRPAEARRHPVHDEIRAGRSVLFEGANACLLDIDHGNGIVTRYGHNTRLLVSEGMTVSAGDEIALAGSTGASTGVHLHFEIRFDGEAVDPTPWVEGG